jgi:hypothetical protein
MLLWSSVPRALESRTKIFGFELSDLLVIFLYLSISNLLVGQTKLKLPVVWLGTLLIAGVLYFFKRNRPEGYLQHLGEFIRRPKTFSAACPDPEYVKYLEEVDNE